jgi:putative transposase
MPYRKTPLLNNNYYHLYNQSIDKKSILKYQNCPSRALNLLNYYRFEKTPLSFHKFNKLSSKFQEKILANFEKEAKFKIKVIAFCLMPTHFHLLLKQEVKNGIVNYLSNFQNAFAKFFNLKYHKKGSLFNGRFKSVLVKDDDQLLHLSRYIHLNPYSSGVIRTKEGLVSYSWSSFSQYLGLEKGFCHPQAVLGQFKNTASYKKFVFDQADYQRELQKIKHLTFE